MKNLLWIVALTGLICGCSPSTEVTDQTDNSENTANETVNALEVKHVDASEAATLLSEEPEVVVLDVRTPSEFNSGHLADAKLVDYRAADFEENLAKLDRDQTYLVHCQSGGRSSNSLGIFEKLGFKNVYHLDGGYSGWVSAGNETVK